MHDSNYLGYDALEQIKSFYHASPHRFEVGDVLVPQPPAKRNFACSAGFVYVTDAAAPHYCIEGIAEEDGWFVYRVEPLSEVRPGLTQDLICDSARVLECLGLARNFRGDSRVTMAACAHEPRTEQKQAGKPTRTRIELAERAIGASVTFKTAGSQKRRKGRVVFADYDTLNVLVDTGKTGRQWLVSLRDCKVLALRDAAVPVLHGARLDVWQHGEGWRGVGIANPGVADTWLEPSVAVAA
jgi:hypothetical protein